MKKILINFAHPNKTHSKINQALRLAVEDLTGITINDLYANYPDFMIDVKREQALCQSHEIIIFQHPFYWYSTPAIMKEWLDLVLEYGWAYGSEGNALKGKIFFQAFSAGGEAETYQKAGYNKFTIKELISPYQATANLCKMIWLPPFTVMGVHRGLPKEQLKAYSQAYREILIALRDSQLNLEETQKVEFLNSDLSKLIRK